MKRLKWFIAAGALLFSIVGSFKFFVYQNAVPDEIFSEHALGAVRTAKPVQAKEPPVEAINHYSLASFKSAISDKILTDHSRNRISARIDELKYPHVIGEEKEGQIFIWASTHVVVEFQNEPSMAKLADLDASDFKISNPIRESTYLIHWDPVTDNLKEFDRRFALLKNLIPGSLIERDYLYFSQQAVDGTWWEPDLAMDYISGEGLSAEGQVIAVLDTGINFNHEDLLGTQFFNPGESINGKDSDGNGFVDDLNGYDFIDLDPDPMDEAGHGTGMAGAMVALDNGLGIRGIAQGAKLLNIRVLDESGTGFSADIIRGIEYARLMHANVISMSLGGPGYSKVMEDSLKDAVEAGILCVAAAGNDGESIDESSFQQYPANYKIDGLLAVGALDEGGIWSHSNYGSREVDWMLPGANILLPGLGDEEYVIASGTSISTAFMSGITALLKASSPSMSWSEIQEKLILTSVPNRRWKESVINYGYLRADNFLNDDYIPIPELEISILTEIYRVGDPVDLSVNSFPYSNGHLTWFRQETPVGSDYYLLTVAAPHPSEEIGFKVVFDAYYAHIESSTVYLSPSFGPLKVSSSFKNEIDVPFGSRFELPAAVEGTQPIAIQWFDEDGNFITQSPNNLLFGSFLPSNQKRYYFTASNGTDTVTSPLIHLKVENMDLINAAGQIDLRTIDVGNGVYLSNLGRSVDGANWEPFTSDVPAEFVRLFFWKDSFYGYTYEYSLVGSLYSSPFGTAWNRISIPSNFRKITPMGEYLVALDETGNYYKSADLSEWSSIDPITDLCFAGEMYFGNLNGQPVYSTNLVDWNSPSGVTSAYYNVVYEEGLWLAGSDHVIYSHDGIHWAPLNSPDFIPERMAFIDGAHFAFASSVFRISQEMEVTVIGSQYNRYDWVKLADGQGLWLGANSYYLERNQIPGGVNHLPLEVSGSSQLMLGEACNLYVDLYESEIQSFQIFNQFGLLEERHSSPFFKPFNLPGIGEHHLSAIIRTNDGELHVTDSRTVENILPPSIEIPAGELDLRNSKIFRSGDHLNLWIRRNGSNFIWENLESGNPVLNEVPWVSITDVFDDQVFGLDILADNNHAFMELAENQWQQIETEPLEWYLVELLGNRLFARNPSSVEGQFDLVENIAGAWVPVVENLPEFSIRDGQTYLDGRSAVHIKIPSIDEARYYYQSSDGQWRYKSLGIYSSVTDALFVRSESDGVYVGGADGTVWPMNFLNGFFATEAPQGIWLPHMKDGWPTRVLLNPDGGTIPFELEGRIAAYPDPTGRYIMALTGQESTGFLPTHVSLYPANEFSLETGKSVPRLLPGEDKLQLHISVEQRQLNVGGRVSVPCAFEIYLCKDDTPTLASSVKIDEFSIPVQLDLLDFIPLEFKVDLPDNTSPGTYYVGTYLNRDNPQTPESNLKNNLVWQEWTLERYATIEKAVLPNSSRISFTPDELYPQVGDLISIAFTPKNGFRFTGWNPEIQALSNPAQLKLPNYLYLSAGEIPSQIDEFLQDVEYTGSELWHTSTIFGFFVGEHYPWIYHHEHGWLYFIDSEQENSAYYIDPSLGWVYFDPSIYPYLYSYSSGRWYYYLKKTMNPRWFFDYTAQQWQGI